MNYYMFFIMYKEFVVGGVLCGCVEFEFVWGLMCFVLFFVVGMGFVDVGLIVRCINWWV